MMSSIHTYKCIVLSSIYYSFSIMLLLKHNIDYLQLNNLRIIFLNVDKQEKGSISLSHFKELHHQVTKGLWHKECLNALLNVITVGDVVIFENFNKLIDLFHYYPFVYKRDKNMSKDIYYILSSNKAHKFGVQLHVSF